MTATTVDRQAVGPALTTLALALLAAGFAWVPIRDALQATPAGGYDIGRMVFLYSTLPRMATALICGAALALSGALFQLVLRNPLASPTTLGVSAGANLALVIATLWLPGLLGIGRDIVALIGSAAISGFVFALGARGGFSPFSLVLSGLVASLWCGALSAVLMLLNERYLVSLFIWGAGSLSQQSWAIPLSLLPKLAVIGLVAALIIRPLTVLGLGDSSAGALGVHLFRMRVLAIAAAVVLAALVTSAVGVIGFIGLVAPIIARLSGARRPAQMLVWSSLIGACLLWLADGAVQYLAGALADFLPTGAVTAVFGSPLLLLLLPRLKTRHRVIRERASPAHRLRRHPGAVPAALALLVLVVLTALFVGRALDSHWVVLPQSLFGDVLPLRLPPVFASMAAGAMLAVAGSMLQRLTGNEMASPEVLGISAGATIGVTLALFMFAVPDLATQLGFAALGSFLVLTAIFLFAMRSGLEPERVLLAGVALSAMVDAVVGVLAASGDPRAMFLMRWMSGSTYGVTGATALTVCIAALALIAIAAMLHRWLDILPLGPAAAGELGLSLGYTRFVLLALAGLLAAAATLCIGPLSFVGLMGPHLAREIGFVRARSHMLGSAFIGAVIMVLADWVGRTAVFPYQIPAGLVCALVGAPFLMLLMRRKA